MSDTDIYKKREPMPYTNSPSKRAGARRRRSSRTRRAFDDNSRKRRSRNSGLRRLLHLYRKKDAERYVWWSALVTLVIGLILLAIWQFVIRENVIRQKEQQIESMQYQNPDTGYETSSLPE